MSRQPHYLDPKVPLATPPAAERNVERVGPCCLDVNTRPARAWKGRQAGAWTFIWVAVGFGGGAFLIGTYFGQPLKGLEMALVVSSLFFLLLFWPAHEWRNFRPVRFNRKTRKVYHYDHQQDRVYVADWDTIRVYLEVRGTIAAGGAYFPSPIVNVEFPDGAGGYTTVELPGHLTLLVPQTPGEDAAALWEYIRRYMEEGPEHLPPPTPEYDCPDPTFRDLVRRFQPLRVFKHKDWPIRIFWELPLYLIYLVFFAITLPTDFLYLQFAKRMHVKPYPPEMADSCACDEAEVNFASGPTKEANA